MLYDRHGPRQLVLAGTFLHVFGIMMTSLGTEYWQIMLAQGVCSALGVAAIFQPGERQPHHSHLQVFPLTSILIALNTIHGWFSTNAGAAFGVVATGSSIGGVIFPIMVTRLIKQVGFGWAMRTCGFLLLALLIVANLTVRAYHPPRPSKITSADLARPFHEPEFVMLTIGFFLFTFGIYVPINYLPVQALATDMDVDLVEYLVPILNAASLFGRIFSGVLGDRIGRYNIFIAVGFLTSLWTLALWIPVNTSSGIIAFAALFGFCSGAYVSLIAPLVAQISPIREIGFRTGLLFLVAAVGGLTTSPINGAILAGPSGLTGIKVFAGVFCFAGTVSVMASRVYRVGWSPTAKF
jgi:MFS family permease